LRIGRLSDLLEQRVQVQRAKLKRLRTDKSEKTLHHTIKAVNHSPEECQALGHLFHRDRYLLYL